MTLKLRCVLLRHKWTPAEETNEPGRQMVCRRCGRVQSFAGWEMSDQTRDGASKPPDAYVSGGR